MDQALVQTLLAELRRMPIVDPHTHVRPEQPVAKHLGDLLGYHYYTELSNSSRGRPEPLPDDPEARIEYVWPHIEQLRGTVQWDWMMGISELLLDIPRADWARLSKREITARAQKAIDAPSYAKTVFERSRLRRVFLTNQFDDDLSFLTDDRLVPCMRTDDFVTYLDSTQALRRLEKVGGVNAGKDLASFRKALSVVFDRFAGWNFACAAAGLAPGFQAVKVEDAEAVKLLKKAAGGEAFTTEARARWAAFAVEEIARQCARVGAAFCLMTGADRLVYAHGVPSGQDQLRSDANLRGYDRLFNEHPNVRFPVLILSDATALELDAAGWIRHNVFPMSHWWYANNPGDIRRGLRRRLEVLPRNKFVGFHSDAYSAEFILPKFNTFRLQMALVLAEKIEESRIGGSEITEPLDVERGLALAERVLLRGPEELFAKKVQA
jgi:glucuronate isomerase